MRLEVIGELLRSTLGLHWADRGDEASLFPGDLVGVESAILARQTREEERDFKSYKNNRGCLFTEREASFRMGLLRGKTLCFKEGTDQNSSCVVREEKLERREVEKKWTKKVVVDVYNSTSYIKESLISTL